MKRVTSNGLAIHIHRRGYVIDLCALGLVNRWRHRGGVHITAKPSAARALAGSLAGGLCSSAVCAPIFSWAFRLLLLMTVLCSTKAIAANLEKDTAKAWEQYVQSTKIRMEQRLCPGNTFLWVDEAADRLAAVRTGKVVVSPVGLESPTRVPSGLIHDWIGAAFIEGASVTDVQEVLRDYAKYKELYKPTVVESKLLAATERNDLVSMILLYKSLLLKTTLDTDYESSYVPIDGRRGYSIIRATRIQEIEEYGTPAQHALPEGEGTGVMWRFFSVARYFERDGGVYIEREAIALSRDIPRSLRWFVEPMIRRVSRASLSTSLRQSETAVRLSVELAERKAEKKKSTAASARGNTASVISSKVR